MGKERKKDTPNKLTIVGGQPSGEDTPASSTNIEKLLLKAATDDRFREVFLNNREAILENPKFSLTPQDKMILKSIPLPSLITTLSGIIEKLLQKRQSRRTFIEKIIAAGFGVTVGAYIGGDCTPYPLTAEIRNIIVKEFEVWIKR